MKYGQTLDPTDRNSKHCWLYVRTQKRLEWNILNLPFKAPVSYLSLAFTESLKFRWQTLREQLTICLCGGSRSPRWILSIFSSHEELHHFFKPKLNMKGGYCQSREMRFHFFWWKYVFRFPCFITAWRIWLNIFWLRRVLIDQCANVCLRLLTRVPFVHTDTGNKCPHCSWILLGRGDQRSNDINVSSNWDFRVNLPNKRDLRGRGNVWTP